MKKEENKEYKTMTGAEIEEQFQIEYKEKHIEKLIIDDAVSKGFDIDTVAWFQRVGNEVKCYSNKSDILDDHYKLAKKIETILWKNRDIIKYERPRVYFLKGMQIGFSSDGFLVSLYGLTSFGVNIDFGYELHEYLDKKRREEKRKEEEKKIKESIKNNELYGQDLVGKLCCVNGYIFQCTDFSEESGNYFDYNGLGYKNAKQVKMSEIKDIINQQKEKK